MSKAVVVHGPLKASWEEVPTPMPGVDEALIRVAYEGVCGTDLEIYEGRLGYFKSGLSKFPLTPGHEFSGWVSLVGAGITGLREGDAVVVECIQGCGLCGHCRSGNSIACPDRKEMGVMRLNGGYAEYVVSPARFLHKVPVGVDMKMAAVCEPLAVVHKGINRLMAFTRNKSNAAQKEYAIIGAGPIGYLSAQLLATRGNNVVVYDKHPKRLSYYHDDRIRTEADVSKLCDLPYFVEATGDPEILHQMLTQSRTGATFLLLGLPYSRKDFNFEDIVAFDKTIIGSVGSNAEDFSAALRLLKELEVRPLFEETMPVAHFQLAWDEFKSRKHLKTILEVNARP
jgi:threonine dehydrogenase-like Zn-dependent dehydrogenase